jgi:hypothetical protein
MLSRTLDVLISGLVMPGIIRVCHRVGGIMGSSAQTHLHAGCLACGMIESGCLPEFEDKLLLWWPAGSVASIEIHRNLFEAVRKLEPQPVLVLQPDTGNVAL